jgi:hypothetical protein
MKAKQAETNATALETKGKAKKEKTSRKETRTKLEQLKLCYELTKVLNHFFPNLMPMLSALKDPRHQSYITYKGKVLLMTRILSSIFYISSMRKTSEELNSSQVIENIGVICEEKLEELPYWETINDYLKKLEDKELEQIIVKLIKHLIRMRSFEINRVIGKHWQIIFDGVQLESSRKELDEKCLYRVHNKGKENEYKEYYYYVLEAKLVLGDKIIVSLMSEFVENENKEAEKQDCELKACYRLMDRIKDAFPCLPICLTADSLYACEPFFKKAEENGWSYIVRFKDGSIPSVAKEFEAIKNIESNYEEKTMENGEKNWYEHVNEISYGDRQVNMVAFGKKSKEVETEFRFITNIKISKKNRKEIVAVGRNRWKIENEGFNTQKNHGYYIEHMFSKNYQGMKNHYYLIQIGHMISQIIESWKSLWKKTKQSNEQKHKRILESFKKDKLKECIYELQRKIQIRLF